jgi:ATP-binding cassette subfamily C (CFTR/MRP) protein 1
MLMTINYLAILLLIPVLFFMKRLRAYYLASSRELKRIEGIGICVHVQFIYELNALFFFQNFKIKARSPVFAHFVNTSAGIKTIRASQNQHKWINQFYNYSDDHTRAYFTFKAVGKWLGVRITTIMSSFSVIFVIICILLKGC